MDDASSTAIRDFNTRTYSNFRVFTKTSNSSAVAYVFRELKGAHVKSGKILLPELAWLIGSPQGSEYDPGLWGRCL